MACPVPVLLPPQTCASYTSAQYIASVLLVATPVRLKALCSFEASVYHFTRHNIPEGSISISVTLTTSNLTFCPLLIQITIMTALILIMTFGMQKIIVLRMTIINPTTQIIIV